MLFVCRDILDFENLCDIHNSSIINALVRTTNERRHILNSNDILWASQFVAERTWNPQMGHESSCCVSSPLKQSQESREYEDHHPFLIIITNHMIDEPGRERV